MSESYTNQVTLEVAVNAGQFIQWQDLFVLVDDGSIPVSRYAPIEAAIREQARTYPQGVALMCVLPADTRPPPEEVKRYVKATLTRLAPSLSSLAYVIEGSGFKAVAVRATLVGMKIFSSRPYPIYVEVSVRETVSKGGSGFALGLTTSDCRKTYETLKARGVEFSEEPTEHPYGIDCGLRDPFGNHLRIVQLASVPQQVAARKS